jgi:hypothetical protein
MAKSMLLVKFKKCCADEFDVNGFTFVKDEEELELLLVQTWLRDSWTDDFSKLWNASLEDLQDALKENADCETECYFGTNQYVVFENFQDYRSSFTTKEVTSEEYNSLVKLFGNKYGFLPLEC